MNDDYFYNGGKTTLKNRQLKIIKEKTSQRCGGLITRLIITLKKKIIKQISFSHPRPRWHETTIKKKYFKINIKQYKQIKSILNICIKLINKINKTVKI